MCANYPVCSSEGIVCPLTKPKEELPEYPFEVHITVEGSEVNKFRDDCSQIGVKPIVLDLQATNGTSVMEDVMTSSVVKGSFEKALEYATGVAERLNRFGHKVTRLKLETVPWHPLAAKLNANQYFESHLAVLCPDGRSEELGEIAKSMNSHRSRNAFKRRDDGNSIVMVTYRDRSDADSFKSAVASLVERIKSHGFEVEKEIVEFAIFDTKVDHDRKWLLNS